MAGIFEGKDLAQPHEFDELVAGSALHVERSESELASMDKGMQTSLKQRLEG